MRGIRCCRRQMRRGRLCRSNSRRGLDTDVGRARCIPERAAGTLQSSQIASAAQRAATYRHRKGPQGPTAHDVRRLTRGNQDATSLTSEKTVWFSILRIRSTAWGLTLAAYRAANSQCVLAPAYVGRARASWRRPTCFAGRSDRRSARRVRDSPTRRRGQRPGWGRERHRRPPGVG